MTTSILDNDLYKFTTSYAYMKMFPQATGTFKFYDRNHTKYTKEEVAKIIQRVWHLQNLALTDEEANFMKNACYFIPTYYFDWLKSFRFNPKQLNITYNEETKELGIEATGLLYEVTLWEVPILAIISEVQTLEQGPIDTLYIIRKTVEKATIAERNNLKFSEFGTRRRASFSVQDLVVETLAKNCPTSLTGTSNCFFAMKYHLTPIGTHPHEWFMFHGAMYGYEHANYMALENWINVYDGDLGIALSDTYTSDVFFKNFSKKHAKLYDGIRQDSGDPFRFIEKAIKYISILNKLKPLKDHWGICFDDFYIKDYPGEYIGLSEDEYNIFKSLICPNNFEDVREKISECLRSETEYSFLVFEKVDVYYYDENGIKYNVEWD